MRTTHTLTAALMALAVLAAACSDSSNPLSNTGPSATAAPSSEGLSSNAGVRVGTLSVKDQPTTNSCAIEGLKTGGQNQANGSLEQYIEMRPGPGITVWESEWQGPRTNVTGRPNTFDGTPVRRFSDDTPILKQTFTVEGVYRVRMKARLCPNVSGWLEFTHGNPHAVTPEPPPIVPIECAPGFVQEGDACVPIEIDDQDGPGDDDGPDGPSGPGGHVPCNAGGGNGPEGCNPGNSGPGHDEDDNQQGGRGGRGGWRGHP